MRPDSGLTAALATAPSSPSGAAIIGIGVPLIILPHSDGATPFSGLTEAAAGIPVFFARAIAFVAALVSIVSVSAPRFGR